MEALTLAKESKFDKGKEPYQNAHLVNLLRNALVHYKPQTLGKVMDKDKAGADKEFKDVEHELVGKLRMKFPLNRLMQNSGNPIFPDKYLGYGCAKWAVTSSKNFADEFFKRIGVIPNYQRVTFDR